jgi:hypothetical protein
MLLWPNLVLSLLMWLLVVALLELLVLGGGVP